MSGDDHFIHPLFLGPAAENHQILEDLVVEFLRDHAFWRRNFHPEDGQHISPGAANQPEFQQFLARTKKELYKLSADLKRAVPFFHPRYIGHMTADLLLPGVIARILTTLYNPNNVSEEAASVTVEQELEAGLQLARMFGFATDSAQEPCAWGHLTSGGTVANYEALWNFNSVKFYGVALKAAARALDIDFDDVGPLGKLLSEYTAWELVNLSIDDTIALRRDVSERIRAQGDATDLYRFAKAVRAERIETRGTAGFFLEHTDIKPPVVLVPVSAHYSWEKGMKVLGLGRANLVRVEVDEHMRLDPADLRRKLDAAFESETPVLAVVGVLGTTEFGNIDPIHEIVAAREECRAKGRDFGLHIDAAWGGYLMSVFRLPDGGLEDRAAMRGAYRYFPSDGVYAAFAAVSEADSVTVDPHKLGYVPYAAGAFVARNREVVNFLTQKAAYVFDLGDAEHDTPMDEKLRGLGQFILEGSKPGAAAASVYVTHKVLPPDTTGFGRLISRTVKTCEFFWDKAREQAERWKDRVRLCVPFEPDTNLVCLAVNPVGNTSLAEMNRFGRALFAAMKVDATRPLQVKTFIGSYTSLTKGNVGGEQAHRVLGELGIDPSTFRTLPDDRERDADHIFLLRHTLMNPWLMSFVDDSNYVEMYWRYLGELIERELAAT
ncbi:MAG: pyridoxal phosphate-dependent decarboxylase family protein [Planctomycetota bacterium]|jgi:glutamate/tyrosine decarboxylase-like PLP-dependent enzyme